MIKIIDKNPFYYIEIGKYVYYPRNGYWSDDNYRIAECPKRYRIIELLFGIAN